MAQLLAAMPDADGETAAVNIEIRNARVITTDYRQNGDAARIQRSQTSFWVADSRGAVRLRLFTPDLRPEQYPDFDVRVGQSVSFLATRLQRRNGERQVISSRNWRLGAQNQTIYVLEPSNELDACGADQDCQAAEAERYEGQLVRVNGILGPDADERAGQCVGVTIDVGAYNTVWVTR